VPASGGLANAEGVPADQVIAVLMNALHHFLRRYALSRLAIAERFFIALFDSNYSMLFNI